MYVMAGKKRAHSSTNRTYKLKIFQFSKLYDCKSNDGPKARSGHRIVCNERSMFAIGGFNPNVSSPNTLSNATAINPIRGHGTVFHEIWRFDFDSKKWTKLSCKNMSTELASCATAMSGNLLFLYGGTGIPFGIKINEEVSVCNLLTADPVLEFNQIDVEGSTKPPKQYGQSVALNGTYFYSVGGTDGYVYSMDIYRLDLRTKVWDKLTSKVTVGEGPTARYRQEVVLYNDYLVVFGGGTSDQAFDLKNIPAFNLKKVRWETFETHGDDALLEVYPDNRRCHACVQNPYDPAVVFINGGVNERNAFSDTWKLDLRTLKWTRVRSLHLPYGIYFHTAAATPDGKMVVFGGVTKRDHSEPVRTSDVYSTWITIPKLKHACWDALLHYVKNGTVEVPSDVKKLGLPPEYEARLKLSL